MRRRRCQAIRSTLLRRRVQFSQQPRVARRLFFEDVRDRRHHHAAAADGTQLVDGGHELIFTLELNRSECEFLTGQLSVADERLAALSNLAATTVEQATVTCLHMDVCTTLGQLDRAVAVGLDYLRHVGIAWSPHPKEEEVRREYERIWSLLGDRTIEDLIDLVTRASVAFR